MPIRWDKRNKRWRYEFDRYIAGQRCRASRLLPAGWSQTQADAFDRTESARLYGLAAGVGGAEQVDPTIDAAVVLYLQDKTALKSYRSAAEHLHEIMHVYTGRRCPARWHPPTAPARAAGAVWAVGWSSIGHLSILVGLSLAMGKIGS